MLADTKYLNIGDPKGDSWIIGQCDVSIRPGWFYHQQQDTLVKSAQELVDIYYKSVGRNAVLLLNLPPNQRGLIGERDVINVKKFKSIIDETFTENLALNAKVTSTNSRLNSKKFSPDNISDNDLESYWVPDERIVSAELIVDLIKPKTFDRILLQEPIKFGQRISKFKIWILKNNSEWEQVAVETTIGYKRLLRIKPTTTSKIKIRIEEATNPPAISNFGLFLSSERESHFDRPIPLR